MSRFYVGLDLGQAQDYTALVVAERTTMVGDRGPYTYTVPFIERFPLGTSYPAIVAGVRARLMRLAAKVDAASPRLGDRRLDEVLSLDATLVVDATGVGRPVVDLLTAAHLPCTLTAVSIHGGDQATHEGNAWRVPKRELVSTVQVLLQGQRVQIAKTLPETLLLMAELGTFKMTISDVSAHDSYNARSGAHDDLVLALALALWAGERIGEPMATAIAFDDDDDGPGRGWTRSPGW